MASEYGGDYDSDSPVKLLDKLLYGLKQTPKQQVVLLSQVRAQPWGCCGGSAVCKTAGRTRWLPLRHTALLLLLWTALPRGDGVETCSTWPCRWSCHTGVPSSQQMLTLHLQVLACDSTLGYEDLFNIQVEAVPALPGSVASTMMAVSHRA